MKKVFISHSSNDKKIARKLTSDLVSLGFDVWMDEKNISVGKSIVESIQLGLSESDFVILLISPDSMKSNWVNKEWISVIKKQIEYQRNKILPALIKQTELPLFLDDIKFANLSQNYARGLADLVKAIYENISNGNNLTYYPTYDSFLKNYSLPELMELPNQTIQFIGFTHNTTLFNYDNNQIVEWVNKSKLFEVFIVRPEITTNIDDELEKYKFYKKKFSYAHLNQVVHRCKDVKKEINDSSKFKVYLLDLPRINMLNIKRIGNKIIHRVIGFNQMGTTSPTFIYDSNNPNWDFFINYIENIKKYNEFYDILE